jgi:uncharacterized protein (DUF1800 family)
MRVSVCRKGSDLPSWWSAPLISLLLAACGGGGGGSQADTQAAAAAASSNAVQTLAAADASLPQRLVSNADAARFLTRATFGPTPADIDQVTSLGYDAWITSQFALPATSHRATWEAADAAIKAVTPTSGAGQDQVWESFWKQAVGGPDQLRLRVVYALSQIFVISALDGNVGSQPRALAAWLDMLGDKGLGTYRELLEAVSLHPLMGL